MVCFFSELVNIQDLIATWLNLCVVLFCPLLQVRCRIVEELLPAVVSSRRSSASVFCKTKQMSQLCFCFVHCDWPPVLCAPTLCVSDNLLSPPISYLLPLNKLKQFSTFSPLPLFYCQNVNDLKMTKLWVSVVVFLIFITTTTVNQKVQVFSYKSVSPEQARQSFYDCTKSLLI